MPTAPKSRPTRGHGRQALVRAAVDVVAAHGLENATVRRIAEQAGVDNTLITHYFGSRDALLTEAAQWAFDRQLEVATVSIEFVLDPDARGALLRTVGDDPVLQLFLYEMTLAARRNPELHDGVVALFDQYVEKMRESLRAHGMPDDAALARALFAIIDGLVLQRVAIASDDEVSEAFASLREFVLNVSEPG